MRLYPLSQAKDYIRSDYYRVTGRRGDSLPRMWAAGWLDTGLRFLFWFRLARCTNPLVRQPARLVYRHLMHRHHIEIQRDVEVGYGFQIRHGGPCVVNSTARIGDNVDIMQYCTIGSTVAHAAEIGDEVYIDPSVCIVEHVKIGSGATIGAGAVVVKDVEAGATVAGVPARVVSHKEPGRLIYRKWDRAWNRA